VPRGWGRTLGSGEGYPGGTRPGMWRRLTALYPAGIAFASATVSVVALVVAVAGTLDPGVVADDPGGFVRSVQPGGFVWRGGIRPGQLVVALSASDDPRGWSIETDANGLRVRATADGATSSLRESAPLAGVALLLALTALLAVPTRRRRAELCAAVALALATGPLWLAENVPFATGAGILAPAALTLFALRWLELRRPLAVVLGTGVGLVSVAYLAVRLAVPELGANLDPARLAGTLLLAAVVLMMSLDLTLDRLLRSARALRLLDAVAGVAILLTGGILSVPLAVPLPATASILVAAVVAYLVLRAGIARVLDRALLAEVRERASAQAAEAERARLSRELHDDPLQALAGVIHRLEAQPNTQAEQATLRSVASRLRDVATELHPPVLDDLGLVPAIESLQPSDGTVELVVSVAQHGYDRGSRPPSDIEGAVFRIVQQAVINAVSHAGSAQVRVSGQVGPDAISIEISDDGRGLDEREVELAMRDGHMGIASMRRRAEAIDAHLSHHSSPGQGTTVKLRWPA
jgi:signal transduction histidine kinase